jgi:hypothetical protein
VDYCCEMMRTDERIVALFPWNVHVNEFNEQMLLRQTNEIITITAQNEEPTRKIDM